MKFLTNIHLLNGWFPPTLFALTALSALLVVILSPAHHGTPRRRLPARLCELIAGLAGFCVSGLVVWLLSDVFLVFGVSLGWMVMLIIAIGIGAATFAVCAAVDSRGLRRAIACAMAVLSLISCAVRVDMVYGEYTTLGSAWPRSKRCRPPISAAKRR